MGGKEKEEMYENLEKKIPILYPFPNSF